MKHKGQVIPMVVAVLLGAAVLYFGYQLLHKAKTSIPGGNVPSIKEACSSIGVDFDGSVNEIDTVTKEQLENLEKAFAIYSCLNEVRDSIRKLLEKEEPSGGYPATEEAVEKAIKVCKAVRLYYQSCKENSNCGYSDVWQCIKEKSNCQCDSTDWWELNSFDNCGFMQCS